MSPSPALSLTACAQLLLYSHLTTPPEPPTTLPPSVVPETEQMDEAGQLHIGDFVLGDGDCDSLTGHPDIRY